jgi:hypothetical protein
MLLACLLGACDAPSGERHADATGETCEPGGALRGELHGAIRAGLSWAAGELSCDGMPRPDGAGARLRLAGPVDIDGETRTLAFIFGIPGLARGMTGRELPTNVTLMEEGTGRFFGTRDTSGCWTDIDRQEAVGPAAPASYLVSGAVYCVTPLAELNGGSSVSFTELQFSGRLDWELTE